MKKQISIKEMEKHLDDLARNIKTEQSKSSNSLFNLYFNIVGQEINNLKEVIKNQ